MVVEPNSNLASRLRKTGYDLDDWVKEVEIKTVNKKYITTLSGRKFVVDDDYREKYTYGGADYKLYESKEQWLEEVRKKELKENIIKLISMDKENEYNLCLLEKINNLLLS